MPKHYILHPKLSILNADQFFTNPTKALELEDKLGGDQLKAVLENRAYVLAGSRHQFIINPTIKTFLSLFNQENGLTKKESIKKMAVAAGCEIDEITPIVKQFFKKMKNEGIIIPKEVVEELPEAEVPVFEAGDYISDLKILTRIHRHKASEVYIAEKIRTGEKMVVKALRCPYKEDKDERKAFVQEFKMMLAAGTHPNICKCYGYANTREYTYGVIEYIKGVSPRKIVKRRSPAISLDERLTIIRQMISAVARLHKRKMTHGDIHASNFLVTDDFKVKMIDFGMTNHINPKKGEIIVKGGVTHYLPPEFITRNSFHQLSHRPTYTSEVYQLGVIAYTVIYETLPFHGLTWHNLTDAIMKESLTYAPTISTGELIPSTFLKILQTMLDKNPANRYDSAMALEAIIEQSLALQEAE